MVLKMHMISLYLIIVLLGTIARDRYYKHMCILIIHIDMISQWIREIYLLIYTYPYM